MPSCNDDRPVYHRPLDRRAFRESLRRRREQSSSVFQQASGQHHRRVAFVVENSPSTLRSAKALISNKRNAAKRAAGWQALGTLPEYAHPSAISALVQVRAPGALRDHDARVRRAVCRALRQLMQWHDSESETPCIVSSQAVVDALVACLEDPVLDVRLAASIALPCMGAGATDMTCAALLKEQAQIPAARVLLKLGTEAVSHSMKELSSLLTSKSDSVRLQAVASFQGLQELTVVERIASMALTDDDWLVRLEAIKVLQACSNTSCLQGHTLEAFTTPEEYTCDRCQHTIPEGVAMHGCRICDYDLCDECAQQACPACVIHAVKEAAVLDKSWEVRRAAVRALPKLGVSELLIDCLTDEDGDVRFAAVDLLGQLALNGDGDKYAAEVAALLGCTRQEDGTFAVSSLPDSDPQVRWSAARSLGRMCLRDVDVVLMRLLNDVDAKVRHWTIWALGKLSQFTPDDELLSRVTELSTYISEDPEPSVRKIAISTLARMGDVGQAARPQVIAVLTQEQDPTVRLAAVEALAEMEEAESSDATGWQELVKTLQDSDRYVRVAAAKTLTTLSQKRVPSAAAGAASAAALAKVVQNDRSWGMCTAAIEALAALGEHGHSQSVVLAQLLELPPTEAVDVRKAAADALGAMGEAGAVHGAVLATGMRADPSDTVRYCCAWALGELGAHVAAHACDAAAALEDSDADVREAAARALGSFGDRSLPFACKLADCLQDEYADVRTAAASALRALGEGAGKFADALAQVLQSDKVGAARTAAAGALGASGVAGRAYNIDLQASLEDDDADVRVAAVVALGELNKGTSAEDVAVAIAKAFTDSNELVRSFALDAIECLGITALRAHRASIAEMIHDEDTDIGASAARLIEELQEHVGGDA